MVSKRAIEKIFNKYYLHGISRSETKQQGRKYSNYKPTLKQYTRLVHHAYKEMGITKISDLTVQRGEDFIRSIEKRYSPYTVKAYVSALNKFTACLGNWHVEFKTDVIRHAPKRGFKPEMLNRIIAAMPERYQPVMAIYRESGIRARELHTLHEQNGFWYVKGKGGLMRYAHLSEQSQEYLRSNPTLPPINSIQREFLRAKKRLSLQKQDGNGLHGIRHTWAREYYAEKLKKYPRTAALGLTSRALGHQRPGITLLYLR